MTGENFKSLNRHNTELDKMRAEYYALWEKAGDAFRNEDDPESIIKCRAFEMKAKLLGHRIVECAFLHFKDWKMANEYCKRYSIFDD